MSIMRILILVFAAGAALVAAMLVRGMSSSPLPALPDVTADTTIAETPTLQVLVAASDLQLGSRLAPEDLSWQAWPETSPHEGFFADDEQPDAITDLAGAVVRTPIYAGEPLIARKIVQPGEAGFMSAILTDGMRAAAVEISVETAAGGFILPNDHVDVILTAEIDVTDIAGTRQISTSQTIIENVRVLAIDQTFREGEDEDVVIGSTATLELPPVHAELLALATDVGEVSLTLRGVSDNTGDGPRIINTVPVDAQRADSASVKVYRNGVLTETAAGGLQ